MHANSRHHNYSPTICPFESRNCEKEGKNYKIFFMGFEGLNKKLIRIAEQA